MVPASEMTKPGLAAGNEVYADAVAYHGELARDWEQRYRKRSFRARLRVIEECMRGREIRGAWLDAGCGAGTLSRWLAAKGCDVLGLDASPEMLEAAMHQAAKDAHAERLHFRGVETIERLPLDSGKFDGILASSVLEYVRDPAACVREFFRVLKPCGVLLVSVPNAASLFRKLQVACHHFGKWFGRNWARFIAYSHHEYSAEEFSDLLSQAGFQVRKIAAFGGPLPRGIQRRRWGGPLLMFVAEKNAGKLPS